MRAKRSTQLLFQNFPCSKAALCKEPLQVIWKLALVVHTMDLDLDSIEVYPAQNGGWNVAPFICSLSIDE